MKPNNKTSSTWQPPEVSHEELIAKWNKNPKFRKAYDALKDEFANPDKTSPNRNENRSKK